MKTPNLLNSLNHEIMTKSLSKQADSRRIAAKALRYLGVVATGGVVPGAIDKQAATESPENERDSIIRRRHMLLVLKRALQGGTIGGLSGGMQDIADQDPTTNGGRALTGLLGGGLVGAGVGAIEGGFRRAIGMDPLLETVAVARN